MRFLDQDVYSVMTKYSNNIAGIYGNRNILVMLDMDESLGRFPISDIICVFNATGNMLLVCERIHRKNYSLPVWLGILRSLKTRGLCYTSSRNYIDIIDYAQWWYTWALDVIGAPHV